MIRLAVSTSLASFLAFYMFSRFDTMPTCDGQTNGRPDILPRHNPHYVYASRGKNLSSANLEVARCRANRNSNNKLSCRVVEYFAKSLKITQGH